MQVILIKSDGCLVRYPSSHCREAYTTLSDVAREVYTSCGEYNGRYYFMAQTNEGPIYLCAGHFSG